MAILMAMKDSPRELNEALQGRYHVQDLLGEGGMARVYLAEDLRHERQVAVKVLDPGIASTVGSERFLVEIRTAATLQHPHILPLFDSGEAGGFLFYVMPYVSGPTLRAHLDRERQLSVSEAVRITVEVARALDYAHRRGVVHRDIKPANILLHEEHALVADFGIARILKAEDVTGLTEVGRPIGSPQYMSPEQATADPGIDHRTDIFSLGCVLYEALAGVPPFDGPSPVAVVSRILTGSPPPASKFRPAAKAIDAVVSKALEPLASDRFATAGEMADALLVHVHSSEPSHPPGGGGWISRHVTHPRIALLLALVVASAAAIWGILRHRPVSSPQVATIAVLPFRPVGDGVEVLAAGITLTTRDRLAVLEGIEVIGGATSSNQDLLSRPAPEIARRIGADYILRATVERIRSPDEIQVHPTLFAAEGSRVRFWDQSPLIVDAMSLSAVETAIAEEVARALDITVGISARANLTPPGSNPAAYEAYLRGRNLTGEARTARMREAIALDSTFALAHADLAHQALVRGFFSRAAADSSALLQHATSAIRHGPELAQGYQAMGLYHRSVTLNADSALYYLNLARSLAPGDADVIHFRASALWLQGQVDSALVEAERGAALDRLNPSAVSRVSRILLWKGELQEAWIHHREALPHALEDGEDFVVADGPLILAAMGLPDSARAYLSRVPDYEGRSRGTVFLLSDYLQDWLVEDSLLYRLCRDTSEGEWGTRSWDRQVSCALAELRRGDGTRARSQADSARASFRKLAEARPRDERLRMRLAYSLFVLGHEEDALIQADSSIEAVNTFWDYYPGAANALAYVRLAAMAGDADRVVSELRPMLEGNSPITSEWVNVDPAFDGIRNDEGFRTLLLEHGG